MTAAIHKRSYENGNLSLCGKWIKRCKITAHAKWTKVNCEACKKLRVR